MSRLMRGGDAGAREPLLTGGHLEEEEESLEDEGEATGWRRLSGCCVPWRRFGFLFVFFVLQHVKAFSLRSNTSEMVVVLSSSHLQLR